MPDPDPLDAGTPQEDPPGPLYELRLGPNACDICEELSGLYPHPPSVPLHTKCECTVSDAGVGGGDSGCETVIRNVQWEEQEYTAEQVLFDDTCGEDAGYVEVRPEGED